MKGRKPIPAEIKKLNGNPGKRPIPESSVPAGVPSCPSWLDAEAKREWKRVVPELAAVGMLALVDRAALAGYCAAYSRWVRAEKAIKNNMTYQSGSTFKQRQNRLPEVQIAIDSLNQVKAFASEFGLTPSARARAHTPEKKKAKDLVEELLDGNRNN